MRRLLVTSALPGLAVVAVLGGSALAAPNVQNNEWNVHILAYGAAAATGKVPGKLTAGQKLSRVFVRCDRDFTRARRTTRCVPATHTTLRPGGDDPAMGRFWTWAEATFVIVDARASKTAAAKIARQLNAEDDVVNLGPATIVILDLTDWTMVDEYVSRGCGDTHGQPCDPVAVKTGRKIRQPDTMSAAMLMGYAMPTDFVYISPLLEMLGSGMWSGSFSLLIPFETVHQDKILDVYNNPFHAKQALTYLEAVQEPAPELQVALAYDRTVIAAYLRDAAAYAAAYKALGEALTKYQPVGATKAVLDKARANLDLLAGGKLSFTAPFGLARYLP